MQTVGKKVVSVILSLVMIIGIMAVGGESLKATAAGYDPDAAISYAKSHWNDGSGDCQAFLKACLKAGGVTITAGGCLAVKNALVNGGYGTLYKLTASGNNYKFSDNSGKVSKGDPLFFVCTTCGGVSSSSAWPHVALCGEGVDGYITDYAHNSAHNGATHKLWKDLGHSSHPNHTMEVYAFHMNTSSTPTTPTGHNPQGCVESIEGRTGCVWVRGWVFDLDAPHISTDIHVYIGGDSSCGEGHVFNACVSRPDVDSVYKVGEYHGYDCIVYTNLSGTLPVYIYGINLEGGDNILLGSGTVTITPDTTAPTATEYGIIETTQDGFTVYCYFDDNVGVTRVQFPTWTPWQGGNNGQDDLIWYEGNFNPDGKSAWARIPISNHNNELGAYTTHIYVWDAAGNCSQYAMGIVVERDAPVISDVVVSDITSAGYTVTCTVTDENCLSRVQFPSWHVWEEDLVWHDGYVSGSSASCRVNISDHGNATGAYTTHIYAWDIWGNVGSINAGTVYVPSESERHTVTYNSNGGTGAPASQSGYVNPSMSIALSKTIPTREGYTFAGWNTQADGLGTNYAPGASYAAEADVTLYAQWIANTPVVSPATGSGTVVDESTHFIYGLSVGAAQGCVAVTDGTVSYEYSNTKQALGTGTKVNVYNNDNLLVDSYTVVVFGDVDGDSWYDGTDAYYVKLAAMGMIPATALTEAQRMAADCNHDGTVDNADAALLEQAGLLLANVDQTLPSEELQTDSVYLEYCSLIDQTVEIIEPDQPTVDQPAQAVEQPAAQSVWGWIKTLFTIVLNWLLRVF